MTEIVIRNQEILERLDGIVDQYFSMPDAGSDKFDYYEPQDAKEKGEYYTSDQYLQQVLEREDSGFPTEHFSHPTGQVVKSDSRWDDFYQSIKYGFAMEMGFTANALFNYYPPGGFVGWHNNWNATAFQILFTWSEKGDGYFKYWDKQKDQIVTIEDKPGWQCRWYYFAPQTQPELLCWHAAFTRCPRITLAYKVSSSNGPSNLDQRVMNLRDVIIEEIESE